MCFGDIAVWCCKSGIGAARLYGRDKMVTSTWALFRKNISLCQPHKYKRKYSTNTKYKSQIAKKTNEHYLFLDKEKHCKYCECCTHQSPVNVSSQFDLKWECQKNYHDIKLTVIEGLICLFQNHCHKLKFEMIENLAQDLQSLRFIEILYPPLKVLNLWKHFALLSKLLCNWVSNNNSLNTQNDSF